MDASTFPVQTAGLTCYHVHIVQNYGCNFTFSLDERHETGLCITQCYHPDGAGAITKYKLLYALVFVKCNLPYHPIKGYFDSDTVHT